MIETNFKRGFSLVELMIAISIFTVLTAMSISSYANFNNRIGTDMIIHTVAQNGHQAQVQSMAVKRSSNGVYPGFGLYFEPSVYTNSYVFYADLDGSAANATQAGYTASGACGSVGDECESRSRLDAGMKITKICAALGAAGSLQAPCPSGYWNVSRADISFKRPNADANLKVYDAGAWTSNVSSIRVYVSSPKGYERSAEFWSTGQISINKL